ncbi:hypothetical protein cyc_03458 [Cyclospora cayetanensis]|uniref:Uncharacterized protein n=1 Tax=Cyclospora cayetanensis TaxID=88456 RepID=A0A1D3CR05_9EIME|nr:hypothetical protein cyc_03458 [Cyclospora cayetanensis]
MAIAEHLIISLHYEFRTYKAMPEAQYWNATTTERYLSQITNFLLQKYSISTQEAHTSVNALNTGGDAVHLLVTACITFYGWMTAITAAPDAPEQQHGNQGGQAAIVGMPAYAGGQAVPYKAPPSQSSPEPVSRSEAPEREPNVPSCTGVFNVRVVIAQHRLKSDLEPRNLPSFVP